MPIFLRQEFIRFRITWKLFLLRVPGEFPAQFEGDHTQQAGTRRAVRGFNIRIGLLAGFYAIQEVEHVRVVLARASAADDVPRHESFRT